jgi:anti-anti-sigma factor
MEAVEPVADPEVAVVALAGELDASDTSWARELDEVVDSGARKLVVDMLNVTFVDSSVIQALILARRRVGGSGWVRLVYTHHLIGRVIDICGLAETFPHYTTVDAALRQAPTRFGTAHGEGTHR